MKWLISLCASACVVGCAIDPDNPVSERGVDEVTAANPASELAPALEVSATDSPERILEVARLASAAACHGTTTCPGGTPLADAVIVECGLPECTDEGCAPGGKKNRFLRVQPQESIREFLMPTNPDSTCFEYHPVHSRLLNTCCFIDP